MSYKQLGLKFTLKNLYIATIGWLPTVIILASDTGSDLQDASKPVTLLASHR